MNQSSFNTNSQKYIQMANLSSGSSTRSSFRSNLRTSDLKFEQAEPSHALYNLPWDVKMKKNPLLSQMSQSSVPPPLPSVPPPSTSKALDKEPQDETQYCAPWDLKLQEEMLKMMAQKTTQKEEDSSAKVVGSGEEQSCEYSPPWEHKQSLLFQQLANSSKSGAQMPAPIATSSASSTLTTAQNSTSLGTIFNKLSLNRLSTRSNNSSASSTRSSTSSLSTSSPPSMPPPPLPPPTLPPLPPPPSSLPPNQQSPLLSQRVPAQPASSSNYLNDKNTQMAASHNQTSFFDSMGSNSSSSGFEDSKHFVRQNRAGSNHHFSYPQQFQTISADGLPVTALVFSQTGSLPNSVLPLSVHPHQSQIASQMPSPSRYDLERQPWFHGRITRKHAENMLYNKPIGSFLVRQSESGNSNDYSLSLVSGSGCVHMRICMKNGEFILGQCSQPFSSIVKMIEHYGRVEVPIKGAQHVKLSVPITPI